MLSKIVKKKEKAFALGREKIRILSSEISQKVVQYYGQYEQSKDKFIGPNTLDITKEIYTNSNFYDYLKYSFLAKYYEKKINTIQWIIIILFVLLGVVAYLIFDIGIIFSILVIILVIGLFLIFKFLIKTGEKYDNYYNQTFLSLLMSVYQNISFSNGGIGISSNTELTDIGIQYSDKMNIKSNMTFSGINCSGKITDLELFKKIENRNKDGSTTSYYQKIFDGFYLNINSNNQFNILRGNTIKIKSDETLFSSLTEDTVKGIYESEKEISFNSEEINKSFDGRIAGYNGFDSVDDMMIQVQKIITPSFEQHLLYLRERYNSFNMNISDNGLVLAINMKRSLFQQSKHNELLDFSTSYREANEDFRMLKADLNGIEDFAYYNVFPFLERIYFINYLTYLYLSYMDFDNYYSINSGSITSFEESMKPIYVMKNKEFKELYTDKIKEIKNNTKEFSVKFEREVK